MDYACGSGDLCFLLTGLAKSGKSTISQIAYCDNEHHCSPLLSLRRQLRMKIVDLPDANIILEPNSPSPYDESLLEGCKGVIFVVDIADDYVNALTKLCALCVRASITQRSLTVEVLLHKADCLSEGERQDVLRDLNQKVQEELMEMCLHPPQVNFHLTSIFDHSLHTCLSRIIQHYLVEGPLFESLLDTFCNNARIEKAFLFDINRKIYLASDSSPVGNFTFEIATEALDTFCDFELIYQIHPHNHHHGHSQRYQQHAKKQNIMEKCWIKRGVIKLLSGIVISGVQMTDQLVLLFLYDETGHPSRNNKNLIQNSVAVTAEAIVKVVSEPPG